MTAPSIYEYRDPREWEEAMAEWCAENEPRIEYLCKVSTKRHGDPLLHSNIYAEWHGFRTPEARAEWLAQHPELTLLEVTEQGTFFGVPRPVSGGKPGCPDHLPGGSASDYRMAGYTRF